MQGIQYLSLQEADIEQLVEPMKRAYESIADAHFNSNDSFTQPCFEDAQLIEKLELDNPNTLAFKVCLYGELIGAFIVRWHEFDESELSHLFIDPKFQRRGIGRQIWEFLHSCYPTLAWRTQVPLWSVSIKRFYTQQCGFSYVDDSDGQSNLVWQRDQNEEIESTGSHSRAIPV